MRDHVLVRFEGDGAGVEDLTWGQLGFWHGMVETGSSATMAGITDLPPETALEELVEALHYVMCRYQTLRTRLRLRPDGPPRQVCSASGEIALRLVDAGAGDPHASAAEVLRELTDRQFDYAEDWPIRMAVISKDGVFTHVVASYLHLAMDAGGLTALMSDLLSRPALTGRPAVPVTAIQPLEQARRQRGDAARRQSAASLRHLQQVLVSQASTEQPALKNGAPRESRSLRYRSPAIAIATARIAATHGVNSAAVLLALFAISLARHTRQSPVVAELMVSNRFRPGFADSVSALVQPSPYLLDVAELSLAEAVAKAGTSLLHTYKNAYYDPAERDALIAHVNAERAEPVDFWCLYNDRRQQDQSPATGTDEQLLQSLGRSSWQPEHESVFHRRKIFLHVDDPPGAIDLLMSVDSRYFEESDIRAILLGIEAVAVQAVLDPSTPTGVSGQISAIDY